MPRVVFYFDLGSPFAYLTAERLHTAAARPDSAAHTDSAALPDSAARSHRALAEQARWQPISLGAIFKLTGRSSWALGAAEQRAAGIADVECRAQRYGLPPIRWPDPWPGNYLMAMRAATFAERAGRGGEFALHAFRGAFRHGRDLGVPEHVLAAARDAGLDPQEVQRATQDDEIKLALRDATDAAQRLGVLGVPTIAVAGELFWGDDRLGDAAAQLTRTGPT